MTAASQPLADVADPRAYLPRPASEEVLAALEAWLESDVPTAVVAGEPGVGTTLVLRVLEARERARRVVLFSPFLHLEPEFLEPWLEWLAFGAAPAASADLAALASRSGARPLLIVDDAHAAARATLAALGALRSARLPSWRVCLGGCGGDALRAASALVARGDALVLSLPLWSRADLLALAQADRAHPAFDAATRARLAGVDLDALVTRAEGTARLLRNALSACCAGVGEVETVSLEEWPGSAAEAPPQAPLALLPATATPASPAVARAEPAEEALDWLELAAPAAPIAATEPTPPCEATPAAPEPEPAASSPSEPAAPPSELPKPPPPAHRPAARRTARALRAAARRLAPLGYAAVLGIGFVIGLLGGWQRGDDVAPAAALVEASPVVATVSAPPPAAPVAPPAAAPVALPPADVQVNALPWATIRIDGREVGVTPLLERGVPSGEHVFEATFPDGRRERRVIHIDPQSRFVSFR
jgi:hypothetical protein